MGFGVVLWKLDLYELWKWNEMGAVRLSLGSRRTDPTCIVT